jgi:hypothetical protein
MLYAKIETFPLKKFIFILICTIKEYILSEKILRCLCNILKIRDKLFILIRILFVTTIPTHNHLRL